MGPWGKDKFNLDICPLLTGDASEYDSVKDGNRKGMRSDADKIHDLTRDQIYSNRILWKTGLTAQQIVGNNHKKRALEMDKDILRHQIEMSKEATKKTKFDMYEKMINLGQGSIGAVRFNKVLDVVFDLMVRFGVPSEANAAVDQSVLSSIDNGHWNSDESFGDSIAE
jgi:hypothetical protein